jgi:nucleoid-associated protein YgaU
MATLTAHLRRSEDHGCLPFHPDCPICRDERLSGTLPAHGLVSRRTQAVLVAGMLAASTATPTVAVAQEADQVSEGAVEPEQSGADSGATSDFDPGGESADLPFEGPEVPDTEAAPDAADPDALETEPVTDLGAPVADAGDEPAPAAAPAPTPAPDVPPPSTAAPAPAPPQHVAELSVPGAGAVDQDLELMVTVNRHRAPRVQPKAPAAPGPATSAPASAPTASAPPVVHLVSAAQAPKRQHEAARSGDRYHVVAAGESLWSISRDVLGDSASPARIAREVNRLWALNSARIATGDPDLLRVGTKLVLR